MALFWNWVDRCWLALASVKLTLVVFAALLLLAIPGTIFLQFNISNVDPGIQYEYDFWKFGQFIQLFSAYHSFWYTGLVVILAMNLIACSVERWPQMLKLARAKPVKWSDETFDLQDKSLRYSWTSPLSKTEALTKVQSALKGPWVKPVLLADEADGFQIFWQSGRWSRISNYLVHSSLLIVFLGAIVAAMYGFEGAANIPSGSAVDTFLIFNEGKGSGLRPAPGGLINERLLGFRIEAEQFDVNFYEDFPGRPKEFISKLNIIEDGKIVKSKTIRVNDPLEHRNFVLYQASYGRLGDFDLRFRVVNKSDTQEPQLYVRSKLGELRDLAKYQVNIVPLRASLDVQNLGPGVLFQEVVNGQAAGEPFWALKEHPNFDLQRRASSKYGVVVDDVKELFYTGLQIGYDPGAPIYWFGCAGMLLGTFYALFVTHRKYYLKFQNGRFLLAGTVNRLPMGFEAKLKKLSTHLSVATKGVVDVDRQRNS